MKNRKATRRQKGFTLVETMISAAVVTLGLVGMLAVFGVAAASSQNSQLDLLARQKATEALESVYAARASNQYGNNTWASIQNTSAAPGVGIFTSGMNPLTDAGPDGLDGTADDVPAGVITVPGPSGVLKGTVPPDVQVTLSNFQRQIQISNVNNPDGTPNSNLRQVQVTIQYPTPQGRTRSYTVQALISSYR